MHEPLDDRLIIFAIVMIVGAAALPVYQQALKSAAKHGAIITVWSHIGFFFFRLLQSYCSSQQ